MNRITPQEFNEVADETLTQRAISWHYLRFLIMKVGVVLNAVFASLHLPYQTCDVVFHHGPGCRRIRQGVAGSIEFGVGHGVDGIVGILAVQGLAGGWAGDDRLRRHRNILFGRYPARVRPKP